LANATEYGLTGSLYTRNAAKIEAAKERFFVGNLYINRKCTGAMVGCHPFGGFNMSGTDSKAGGPDYLLQFLQAKSIATKVG
jgi:1-pyrroline-5-carboxylate dehydrogenase